MRVSARARATVLPALFALVSVTLMPLGTHSALAVSQTRIRDVQGSGHISPLAGQQVTEVPGVVTALDEDGFWMQDRHPDGSAATSEGIFVYTESRPQVVVGDAVTVNGTVREYRPGGAKANLTTTEITATGVGTVDESVTPPDATTIGPDGRMPPQSSVEDDAQGDVEDGGGHFQPRRDGLDFYESLEGMRLSLPHAVAVGPTNRFGEIPVLTAGGAGASVRTARGGIALRQDDPNPERILLDNARTGTPTVKVGDRFAEPAVGVLDYSFGNFKLQIGATPKVDHRTLPREKTRAPHRGELAIATYNVENLDPTDPSSKFTAIARQIVHNLQAPDIVAVEEIQDNNGAANDDTVRADRTFTKLISAISEVGGPTYDWQAIAPRDDTTGGEPGGNIRVGFLFRTDRGLDFVDRGNGDATSPTRVAVDKQTGTAHLTLSPGLIDPTDPAFTDSRRPLAGEFRWHGETVIVIANHWSSKGGDDPLFGRYQPPRRPSEEQRLAQAEVVAGFVDGILAKQQDANVVVAGDLNDFPWSAPVMELRELGLVDLPAQLPPRQRYTYLYQGNSQVLDHMLLSPALAHRPHDYDIVHVNAEYAKRASDHDPQVARLRFSY